MNIKEILARAADSVLSLQNLPDDEVSQILREVAEALRDATGKILEANSLPLPCHREGVSPWRSPGTKCKFMTQYQEIAASPIGSSQ